MSEENCDLCGARIHSITVRSFEDYRWCSDCGDDIMLPLLHVFVHGVMNDVQEALTYEDIFEVEVAFNRALDISGANQRKWRPTESR